MRRVWLSVVGAGLLAFVLVAPAAARMGFTGPTTLPGSGPTTKGGSDGGNEPSIAISPSGIRYASWQAPGEFARSSDGLGFTNLGVPDPNAIGDVTNAVDAAGVVYNAQVCGDPDNILHTCVYRSFDHGRTWVKTQLADMHPGASDRPWIDVYPKRTSGPWDPDHTTVYLEYHTFSPEDLAYVTVSHDGGATFSEPKFITADTNAVVGSACNTVPGGVVADDRRPGTVHALWISGNDVAANATTGCNYSQIGPFDKAWVSTSTDSGATWTSHQAWQGAYDPTTKIGDNADKIFGTIGVDRAGQIQVLLPVRHKDDPTGFVAGCQTGQSCQETPQNTDLLLVTSPDRGAHWTRPFAVRGANGSYFFPWVAAGSAGRFDAIYYHSSTKRPNDPKSTWYAAAAQVTGAVAAVSHGAARYTATPQISETLLDPNPAHVGGICTFGIFCSAVPNANRNLADSIAIALDPAGGANAVWTNDLHAPESHISFACQKSGLSAFGGTIGSCYRAR